MSELSSNLDWTFDNFSSEVDFGFENLGKFFGGSADLGKGLVYMVERVLETLNIK